MMIKTEQFQADEALIWTRSNGITERVRFKSFSKATVSAGPVGSSAFPNQPIPTATVVRSNGKGITVPLTELSQPE